MGSTRLERSLPSGGRFIRTFHYGVHAQEGSQQGAPQEVPHRSTCGYRNSSELTGFEFIVPCPREYGGSRPIRWIASIRAVSDQLRAMPSISRHRLTRNSYEPFLSRNRDLWIICSFTEEKAHRQALRLSGQTQRLLAVFCHPTFTRHHRCAHDTVSVASLSEFLRELSPAIHKRYVVHARFLINHLRQDSHGQEENLRSDSIRELVRKTERPLPIHTSDLREAKAGLGLIIATSGKRRTYVRVRIC